MQFYKDQHILTLMSDPEFRTLCIANLTQSQMDGERNRKHELKTGIRTPGAIATVIKTGRWGTAADLAARDRFRTWPEFELYGDLGVVPDTTDGVRQARYLVAKYVLAYPSKFGGDAEFLAFRFVLRQFKPKAGNPDNLVIGEDTEHRVMVSDKKFGTTVRKIEAYWVEQQRQLTAAKTAVRPYTPESVPSDVDEVPADTSLSKPMQQVMLKQSPAPENPNAVRDQLLTQILSTLQAIADKLGVGTVSAAATSSELSPFGARDERTVNPVLDHPILGLDVDALPADRRALLS